MYVQQVAHLPTGERESVIVRARVREDEKLQRAGGEHDSSRYSEHVTALWVLPRTCI
jgi:hypothetical protein